MITCDLKFDCKNLFDCVYVVNSSFKTSFFVIMIWSSAVPMLYILRWKDLLTQVNNGKCISQVLKWCQDF